MQREYVLLGPILGRYCGVSQLFESKAHFRQMTAIVPHYVVLMAVQNEQSLIMDLVYLQSIPAHIDKQWHS